MNDDDRDPSLARDASERKSMRSLISSSLPHSIFGALIPSIPIIAHLVIVSVRSKHISNYGVALSITVIWVGFLPWLTSTIVKKKFISKKDDICRYKSPISYFVHLSILVAINIVIAIVWFSEHFH